MSGLLLSPEIQKRPNRARFPEAHRLSGEETCTGHIFSYKNEASNSYLLLPMFELLLEGLYEGRHVNMPGAHSRCFVSASLPSFFILGVRPAAQNVQTFWKFTAALKSVLPPSPHLLRDLPIQLKVKLRLEQGRAGQRAG